MCIRDRSNPRFALDPRQSPSSRSREEKTSETAADARSGRQSQLQSSGGQVMSWLAGLQTKLLGVRGRLHGRRFNGGGLRSQDSFRVDWEEAESSPPSLQQTGGASPCQAGREIWVPSQALGASVCSLNIESCLNTSNYWFQKNLDQIQHILANQKWSVFYVTFASLLAVLDPTSLLLYL